MKQIKIGNSEKFILVDDIDFEELNKHKWLINKGGYPQTRYKTKLVLLHKLLVNFPETNSINVCDHINRNRLDYRRENLRVATRIQNNANRIPNINSKLGTKGVSIDKRKLKNKFYAYICSDNKKIHIGYFATIKEAAEAYNKEAIKKWGEFALLNNIEKL